MNPVDVLRGAKEILSDESRWCRSGNYAVNGRGAAVRTTDRTAARFCGLGAVAAAAGIDAEGTHGAAYDIPAARALIRASVGGASANFIGWNDRKATHADLIDAFDRAILSLAGDTKAEREAERREAVAPVADAVEAVLGR